MATTHRLAMTLALVLMMSYPASAMKNPAAVYCSALGYEYVTEINEATGGSIGMCKLSESETVDAWKFIQGEVAEEKSYCAQEGYELEVSKDWGICGKRLFTSTCAVCIQEDGTRQEVTELMGLNFHETECGDGRCGLPEDYSSCPNDCPSGGTDEYCDKITDGLCDGDCQEAEDPDCGEDKNCIPLLLAPLAFLFSVVGMFINNN